MKKQFLTVMTARLALICILPLLLLVPSILAAAPTPAPTSAPVDTAAISAPARGADASSSSSSDLAKSFVKPPDSARPRVYWFWLNSNITREWITADLEAMMRVGIGGVLIMEVDQGAPVGPAAFMGQQWRDLFKFAVSETWWKMSRAWRRISRRRRSCAGSIAERAERTSILSRAEVRWRER